jgi:hypothetical protein
VYDFLWIRAILRSEVFLLLDDLFQGAFRYHTSLCSLSGTQRSETFCIFSVCIDLYGDSNEIAFLMNEDRNIEIYLNLPFVPLSLVLYTEDVTVLYSNVKAPFSTLTFP